MEVKLDAGEFRGLWDSEKVPAVLNDALGMIWIEVDETRICEANSVI
jgi:hypothetical protein